MLIGCLQQVAMSSLLNATTNQHTQLVKRVRRQVFNKTECRQQAAECFWAIRATIQQSKSSQAGKLALSDRVQAALSVFATTFAVGYAEE